MKRGGVPDDSERNGFLGALERARTRFVVAIAAESKSTPLDRRLQYLQTEQRIRDLVKELRSGRRLCIRAGRDWNLALDALGRRGSDARTLHGELREIVDEIANAGLRKPD